MPDLRRRLAPLDRVPVRRAIVVRVSYFQSADKIVEQFQQISKLAGLG